MFEVLEAGGLVTVQDAGRTGWRRYGVPASGAMDEFAQRAANLLVDNPPEAATLEIGGGDLVLRATGDHVLAVSGVGYELTVNTWTYPLWESYFVRGGWTIRLEKTKHGMWAYLAAVGGFDAAPVLGSRSTYLRGHFGGPNGRALETGDVLRPAGSRRSMMETAGRGMVEASRPDYSTDPVVDVIPDRQDEALENEGPEAFFASAYLVSAASDRMGYRLEGATLAHRGRSELVSQGIAPGVVQVPPDGSPIVMMADSATAGGYPRIACVIRADIPLLAQCRPGKDEVRFRRTTVEAAQRKYRAMMHRLHTGIVESE